MWCKSGHVTPHFGGPAKLVWTTCGRPIQPQCKIELLEAALSIMFFLAESLTVAEAAPLEAPNRNICKSFSQLPLSSEFCTNKAVNARFWTWLELFLKTKGFKAFEVVLISLGSGRMICAQGDFVPVRDHPA